MDDRQKNLEYLNQRKSTHRFGRTLTPRTSDVSSTSTYRNDTVDTDPSNSTDMYSSRGMLETKSS